MTLENTSFFEKNRETILQKNREEFARLADIAQGMKEELLLGKLSPQAKEDLEKQLADVREAMKIIRETIATLSDNNSLLVEEVPPVSFEVTNVSDFLHEEYMRSLRELDDLEKERELLFDIVPGSLLSDKLKDVEKRIVEMKALVEEKRKQFEERRTI